MSNFLQALQKFKEKPRVEKKLEYRLYYDEKTGKALHYAMEELEGTYIEVDRETYVRGKIGNISVEKGKIVEKVHTLAYKLYPYCDEGTHCHESDITIVDETGTMVWGD